jgi:hypothetical protein
VILGAGVYQSLGFRDLCRIDQYIWVPQAFNGQRRYGTIGPPEIQIAPTMDAVSP